jgi:GAF domain-containing protein
LTLSSCRRKSAASRSRPLFYRQLQQVSRRIHDSENVDQIMLEASQDICKLLNAERLTLYAVNEDSTAIVSKVKTAAT